MPKRVLQSLDFTVNRVLMKLLKSSNIVVIEQCRYFFHIPFLFVVYFCMYVFFVFLLLTTILVNKDVYILNCHLYSSRDVLRNFWQMLLMTIRFISA